MLYLNNVHSPADVKKLDTAQLQVLGEEIRTFLIQSVSKTGGHLSSNLGTIEMTLALHKVFTSPIDQFVWDVGHQCYTHKILTGRKDGFAQLRMMDGISGFPNPKESEHDVFISGHGNTSLSVAIGLATAKKLRGEAGKVIAIVGDGAFTGGMIYEGMNNIRALNNLIVILNDNKMSISKNVGSVAQYLTQLRTSPKYFKMKRDVESFLEKVPVVGTPIIAVMQNAKSVVRRFVYNSTMFEEMGFQYAGPIDGHDMEELTAVFSAYEQEQTAPLFLHLVTVKGKGFQPAEQNPGEFHGVSAFDLDQLTDPDIAPESSFSTEFGKQLANLADTNQRLCAVTAAMKYGTGLQFFYKQHKERFFDVGMAEQHAVTFGAGLATNGLQPVVSIYSTFLQRAYDQIQHDVSLMQADVLLAVDRAGFVPGDGETHQGIYDAAYLSHIAGMRVVSPCNYAELHHWLSYLISQNGPRALRYPRGGENETLSTLGCTGKEYDCYAASGPAKVAFVSYGAQTECCLQAAQQLQTDNINVDVYKLCVIHPLPQGIAEDLQGYNVVIFAEEGIAAGGIGEHLCTTLARCDFGGKYRHVAVDNAQNITHAQVAQLRERYHLDANSLAKKMKEAICEN